MVLALDPPVVASATDTGLILDIVGITIADPLGRGEPQLRLRDGTTIILPVSLRDWAMTMLVTHHHRADAEVPVFPCRIEFGVRDGHMYARPLSVDEHHDVP
ncbi:hypothetical protein A5780_29860 [Nocardia sp. 852002-20019_SCH5090214]|uniref:Uncharacterized protein n=1 Tax=Nocardia nova TaxID=37330 RepID=A0A2S5ZXE2_9NOCA|nr:MULTISPECIES: hypothetical protein [Nocardia]OBA51145.1 hypothetical protein A5780_29860 [Nocardia sp. 852002-20019_SCH5090214]PPI99644.1 hypothetical protein C5E46_04290 [Nocardia nova]PPJ04319.1 hypothetical protein C5E51_25145 [Nocardia nova]PPJ22655.1 hypothetical protein C5F51_30465 [Nocardia nova]